MNRSTYPPKRNIDPTITKDAILLEGFHTLEDYFIYHNPPPGIPLWAVTIAVEQTKGILSTLITCGMDEDYFLVDHKSVMNTLYAIENRLDSIGVALCAEGK